MSTKHILMIGAVLGFIYWQRKNVVTLAETPWLHRSALMSSNGDPAAMFSSMGAARSEG